MPGTREGAIKGWLKRLRSQKASKGKKKSSAKKPRPETEDTLQEGQTIAEMSKKWGVSIKSIIKLNDLTSPDQITAGMKLRIPEIKEKQTDEEKTIKALEDNKKAKERAKKKKK